MNITPERLKEMLRNLDAAMKISQMNDPMHAMIGPSVIECALARIEELEMAELKIVEAEVHRLALKEDEVLIVKVRSDEISEADLHNLGEGFKQILKNKNVVVLGCAKDDQIDLTVGKISEYPQVNNYCSDCSCGKKAVAEGT